MGVTYKDKERHVIPRWRDAFTTSALGEADSADRIVRRIENSKAYLQERIDAWQEHGQLGFAADLVGAALTLGEFEVADAAANFILAPHSGASPTIRAVAARILGTEAVPDFDNNNSSQTQHTHLISSVRYARVKLREDPRNAIAWTDLARAYASLGEDDKARRAMHIAIILAQTNRFVLRASSRLAIHVGEIDEAHQSLRRSQVTPYDPWLLAAEIAAADLNGRSSRFVKKGREYIRLYRTLFRDEGRLRL